MSTIAQEIMSIATEHGYTGAAQSTIAGAINVLADTLAGSDATDGSTIAGAVKALAPYVGEVPSGTISITENGTDIDVASYAKADVSVSGGGTTYGDMAWLLVFLDDSAPTVGDSLSIGNSQTVNLVLSGDSLIAIVSGVGGAAAGLKLGTTVTNVTAVTALYVVTVSEDEHDGMSVSAVSQVAGSDIALGEITWDGETSSAITWTMPELQSDEALFIVVTTS